MPLGEQLVGRRLAAGHRTIERREIDRLVVTLRVDLLARPQTGMGDLDHVAGQLGEHAAAEHRGKPGPRRFGAQVIMVGDSPVLHQIPGGIERRLIVEQPDPQGGQGVQRRQRTGVGAAHFEVALQPHLGKGRGDVIGPVAQGRLLARSRRQLALQEIAEALPRSIDVLAVAIDEVHRHIEHVVGIALEAEAVLEHEGQHATTVGIGVGPDVAAVALEARLLALLERRVGEQRGGDGLQRQRDAELLHHVGFGVEVEIGLHRTGAQHHVDAELALLGHVLAHDLVAALGHPVHVGARPFRSEAETDEGGTDLARHRLDLVDMLGVLRRRLVQGLERRAGKLELAARLQGDVRLAAQQRDRIVALGDGFPTEARHAFEHGADAVGTIVGERLQGRRMIAEFLMLGAQAPIGPRLVAGSKIFDELAPIFDRFAAARWRCGHSFSSPSAPRRLLSAGSGAVA